jgi:uncharacterized 2Fe-2S/4Fe-4S cluster protein (DUF4445 family)
VADSQIKITFEPTGRTVAALAGVGILEAAAQVGLTIDTPCGGAATCGKCRVQFRGSAPTPAPVERDHFSQQELDAGWRLACCSHPTDSVSVEIPVGSLFTGKHQILQAATAVAAPMLDCGIRTAHVTLPPPTLTDAIADVERLTRQIGTCRANLDVLRRLHGSLRAGGYRGTAVLADDTLIDFQPGDSASACYGVAVDIGTTTLVGSLHDLASGEELAVTARLNSQTRYGDDVLSRIRHAAASARGLEQMRSAVESDCAAMVRQLCSTAGVAGNQVYIAAVAGNTTMQHLAVGIDPECLGQVPFIPVQSAGMCLDSGDFNLPLHPAARVHFLPVVGGFVGGDSVAGLVATELADQTGSSLLIDIGTNGEIVLACDGQLWATSAAAGPAFEGARISDGMRAAEGAIEKVSVVDGQLIYSTVGGVAPRGICGSGLIDAAAEMLRCGVITPEGRLLGSAELPANAPQDMLRRIATDSEGKCQLRLAEVEAADGKRTIAITQRDVRELQLASGAIRAATRMLLRRAGLSAADLDRILLAGGFGSFIRRSNAQRLGLLPPQVAHDRIRFVGNTSLAGAQCVLLSRAARERAEQLACRTELVELSTDPQFQHEFAEAMIFPNQNTTS